ncbi:MAG: prolipoprotein diacylglyceryl transferase family protein [Candidatus Limnocylindria bacterium]
MTPRRAGIETDHDAEHVASKPTKPDEPQALVVSYVIEPGDSGDPYTATIRVRGKRIGAGSRPNPRDTFSHDEIVRGVVPGAGPVAVTSWIYGVDPGEWRVEAELIAPAERAGRRPAGGPQRANGASLSRADWSWRRWALTEAPDVPIQTRWALLAPLARTPAVVPGSFTVLAILGISASFVVQATLLERLGVSVGGGLLVSFLAIIGGIAGAKLWHMILQAKPWRESIRQGWSVDGFLVLAPIVAIAALLALDIPIGRFLDSAAPGMYVAVTIGRLGCFFTGCCAGRPTRSRFGIRSSDRRIVARRIPTQLLESLTGLVLAIASWIAVANDVIGIDGAVFFAVLAVYVIVRQGLLRMREETRAFSWRRSATAGVANR